MVSSPKPPNPYQQAAAQQSSDLYAGQSSAIINNPNESNPYGSVTYGNAGYETVYDANGKPTYVPRYTRTVNLSPDQQRLLGLQTQTQYNLGQTAVAQSSKLKDYLGQSVNTAGLQGWKAAAAPGAIRQDQAPTDRQAVENAMMSRFNTDAARQQASQDAQLAARGLGPGGQGYGAVQEQRDRARTDALNQAYLASGEESRAAQAAYNAAEQQRYQEGSDYASQFNNLRQAQMQERLALRNQPLNEISALLSGSQVTTPQFSAFSRQGINAAPVGSYISSNYANAANAAAQQNAGWFNLGTSLLGGAGYAGGFGKLLAL